MELNQYDLDKLKLLHSSLTSSIRQQESLSVDKNSNPLQFWVDKVQEAIIDREFEDNNLPF